MIYRVVGAPPGPGATRAEHLRWVRHFYRLGMAAIVLLVIIALLGQSTLLLIVAAVLAAIWVGGLAAISLRIKNEGSSAS